MLARSTFALVIIGTLVSFVRGWPVQHRKIVGPGSAISMSSSLFEEPKRKKKKKNKYSQFSKADSVNKDPFEAMLEESKLKSKQIHKEMTEKSRPKEMPLPDTRLQFPNNKDINPYDPTTFGYIEIGTITGCHGVHGWTKVKGCTDFPERLTRPGMLLHLKPFRKRAPRKVILTNGKMTEDKDSFIIQLQGVYDRDAATKLKGATLYYATQEDTVLAEDDMLLSDLVGLDIFLENERDLKIGKVDGIVLAEEICSIPGLGQDMMEVEIFSSAIMPGKPKELVLIPFVPEIVPIVDLENQMILIDPPSGLLDLTYIREEKVTIKGLLPPAKGRT